MYTPFYQPSILYNEKNVSAVFFKDGKGNVLEGIKPYFDNDLSLAQDGVITTLDSKIQSLTETALSNLNSGCAIVAELENGTFAFITNEDFEWKLEDMLSKIAVLSKIRVL